jgi:hypothetical protein
VCDWLGAGLTYFLLRTIRCKTDAGAGRHDRPNTPCHSKQHTSRPDPYPDQPHIPTGLMLARSFASSPTTRTNQTRIPALTLGSPHPGANQQQARPLRPANPKPVTHFARRQPTTGPAVRKHPHNSTKSLKSHRVVKGVLSTYGIRPFWPAISLTRGCFGGLQTSIFATRGSWHM